MTVSCPSCASELADGMRFCGVCGTKLIVCCSVCGTPVPSADHRFCGACGAPLPAVEPAVRERRLVSVVFCDLVGFTTFSEGRDHEDVRDVLEHYFNVARRIVADYQGTVEKFIGDAVMAVWGAPVAREDDAERSVRAALDLIAAVESLARGLAIPELRARVGVLTGEASVDIGRVHEGMVIGDSVNTAARIQSLAEPNTVLVDDVTRQACERAIEFESGGVHRVGGRTEPVRVWRALRAVPRPGGRGRTGPVEPPLVGRQLELQIVKDALDEVIRPGAGIQLLSVLGEAGIGKTRLAWELEKHADGITSRLDWHRGRAVPFGDGTGMSALAEMMRMRAGIALEDPARVGREKLDSLFDGLFETDAEAGDRAHVRRAVDRLLELDDGQQLVEPGELFSGWRLLLERLAARKPAVLVFEEMQHAGRALLHFIGHLLDWAQPAPILIAVVARPDPRLEELAARGRSIQLQPLTVSEMDELVAGSVREAPETLLAAVRAEGGGIPLYAVETLRALADQGALAVQGGRYVVRGELGEMAVPPTIRALVASRLDRLGKAERRVLVGGAVLGEWFETAGAAALGSMRQADAEALLDGLVAKALLGVDRDQLSPARGQYFFLQGVTRRVMVDTLARGDRKRLHLSAADHLARAEFRPDRAALLAGHLLAAAEAEPMATDARSIRDRARGTLRQAAERAAAVGALEESLSLFDRALGLVEEETERASILEQAATIAYRAGEADAAAARYRAAGEIHAAAGRENERLRAHAYELRSLRYQRDPGELLPQLRELHAALGTVRDSTAALVAAVLAFTLYQCGEHPEALELASLAAAIAEECGAHGELLLALGAQAAALAELDRQEEAIGVYARGLPLARRYEPRREASFRGNLAVSLCAVGRYAEAAQQAEAAIAAAQRTAERFFERWGRLVLARASCSLGDWDRALVEIESVKDDVPPFSVGMAIAPLVVIAHRRGQHDRVRELVAEHDKRCGDAGVGGFDPDFRSLRAAVLADGPDRGAVLTKIVTDAEVADYSEWAGWLGLVIDELLAISGQTDPLAAALTALLGPEAIKRAPPVRSQALRIEAHLAARAGDRRLAAERFACALELTEGCGLAVESAVIMLEQAELDPALAGAALDRARSTLKRLGATPSITRADAMESVGGARCGFCELGARGGEDAAGHGLPAGGQAAERDAPSM
jgi:class 3 adenylate cyclase/tetratricopeptide (TPR) repeat protein